MRNWARRDRDRIAVSSTGRPRRRDRRKGRRETDGWWFAQPGAQRFAADHRGLFLRGIQQIIGAFEQRRFVAIEDAPFDKKARL
jgi:hypothetical protein